jgi:hypothetical protein
LPINVDYRAGNKVILKPGFKVSQNTFIGQEVKVNIIIDPTMLDDSYYYKTYSNPCSSSRSVSEYMITRESKDLVNSQNKSKEDSYKTNLFKSNSITISKDINKPLPTSLNMYPNPTENIITIENRELIKFVTIEDLSGHRLQKVELASNKGKINISNLDSGTYIIKILTERELIVKKLIKL